MEQLASKVVPAKVAPAPTQLPSPALPHASTTSLDPRRFDGTWLMNVACLAAAGAQGYSYQFTAQVKDGIFRGQYGTEGKPGSTTFDGKIQPDGTADIYANGLTNASRLTVGNVPPGTNFSYHITSRFEDSSGVGNRVELRPCNFTFVKK
jgi:hypothetical protein